MTTAIWWIVLVVSITMFVFCMWKINPLQHTWFHGGFQRENEKLSGQAREHIEATDEHKVRRPFAKMRLWFTISMICALLAAIASGKLFG